MTLKPPPKYESLLPFLLQFVEKKLGKTFSLPDRPFLLTTKQILETFDENSCILVFLERLLLENFQNNFYSLDLLKILLEVEPVSGYLFSFETDPPTENFPFFQISNDVFFYPLFFENVGALFIDLWNRNASFSSIYTVLHPEDSITDFKENLKILEIAKNLGFTRFGTKALDDLVDILNLYKNGEGEEILHYLMTEEAILVISEGSLTSLEEFRPVFLKKGKKFSIMVFEGSVRDMLFGFLSDSSCYSGSVGTNTLKEPLYSDLDPFLLTYACLEHAKRAGKRHHHLDPFTLHVLADLFYEWEDYGSALKLYLRAKEYTLQPLELSLSLASIYYMFGDLSEAERILRSRLCGCHREDPKVHYNLGVIYLRLGKKDHAEYHLYKAFLLAKNEPLFRKQLVKFLWDEGRLEDIREVLEDLPDLTPEEKAYLGKIAFMRGDYESAFNYLRDLLNYRDRDGISLYFLAWLYMYFRMDGEVVQILLNEAKNKLSEEEFEKLRQEFGLPR